MTPEPAAAAAMDTFGLELATVLGRQVQVFRDRPRSLRELGQALVDGAPEQEWLVCGGTRYTRHGFWEQANAVSHALHRRGVRRGDRVAIAAANSPEWAMAYWGAINIGAVAVPLNGWWTAAELAYALADSSPAVVVADRPRADRLTAALTASRNPASVFVIGEPQPGPLRGIETVAFSDVVAHPTATSPPGDIDEDDAHGIFYTSGSTGSPKGVVLTHRSWIFAVQAMIANAMRQRATAPSSEASPPDVRLVTMPLFHVSGCMGLVLLGLLVPSLNVLSTGRFDAEHVMGLIEEHRVTGWAAVPTMLERVCDHQPGRSYDLSSVRRVNYGGAPPSEDLLARLATVFPNLERGGNSYGLSEAGGVICTLAPHEYRAHETSVGRPAPGVEVRVDADGGEHGEVLVRAASVMAGYWRDEEATRAVIDEQGWLHTGDIGFLDAEGFLHITDRQKDLIIRGGENISPAAIEARIAAHPEVADVAVIGVPHHELGEVPKAVVRLHPGSETNMESIQSWVGDKLAYFMVPASVEFVDEPLPRNATGKLMKHRLRGRAASN